MSYKCPFCPRTFSTRSAYSQHVGYCVVESSSEESNDQNIEINEGDQSFLNYSDQSISISEGGNQSMSEGGEQSMSISEMSFNEGGEQSMSISEVSFDEGSVFEDVLEDILEESESEVNVNYPNEAYGDLMALVTKHKLNNKTGNAIIKFFNKHSNLASSPLPVSIEQGRKYMDNMNLPSLTFQQTCVINYNNTEYYLHHRSLLNCVKNILSIPDILQNFALTFENLEVRNHDNYDNHLYSITKTYINYLKHDGERIYSEQNTGTWWQNTEKSLPRGSKLLSIMLYSDATNVDTLGKKNLHPIYMSIGNIKNWRRNKPNAKQLLGYLPILKASDNTEKKSENFKIAVRKAFHKSLEVLLDPFLSLSNGIDLDLNNESIWFFPRISVVIADLPEAATYCLTYKSALANFPCHFCLVKKDDLADINLTISEMELRTHDNMRQFFDQNLTKSVSIEDVNNFFWKFP